MVEGDPVDWTFDLPITDWINGDNIEDAIKDKFNKNLQLIAHVEPYEDSKKVIS